MKKFNRLIIAGLLLTGLCSCGEKSKTKASQNVQDVSLNVSIFIDLSNRIIRDNVPPSQVSRDSAIVAYVADWFVKETVKEKLMLSKSKIRIVFYPTPGDPRVNLLAAGLNLDMEKVDSKDKRQRLKDLQKDFSQNLGEIYKLAIKDNKFTGSDIWGFFDNKTVDALCVNPKARRNILIVLTDGYLYDVHKKIKKGNAYSYILPETLKNPQSSLLTSRSGLDNLEVLMLEVNLYDPMQRPKMVQVLEDWFKSMGVKHYNVAETDVTPNTQMIIDNFL